MGAESGSDGRSGLGQPNLLLRNVAAPDGGLPEFHPWPPSAAPAMAELARPTTDVILTLTGNIRETNVEDRAEFDRAMLVGLGYEVLEAVDGSRALEVIAQNELDLVLTDIDMPVMNAKAMKLTKPARPTPARAASPNRPTIAVSTRLSTFWETMPPTMGSPSPKFPVR